MPQQNPRIIVITGPTASGKTALATALAEKINGTVINADSQQVYRELRILTARPTPEEEARAPHALYGHIPAATRYSAGQWHREAVSAIHTALNQGRTPILVGGTGMYIRTLYEGFAEIPDIPPEVRHEAESILAKGGIQALHADLLARDPRAAETPDPNNPHRLIRAWEVVMHTGRSLYDWQKDTPPAPFPREQFACFALLPDRRENYATADRRVPLMVEEGALEEVKNLLAQRLDPSLPAMKSHGVREFARHLSGEWTRERAIEKTQQITRHYIKRQHTWLRRQCPDYTRLEALPTGDALRPILAAR